MRHDLFYVLVLFLAEVLRVLAFFADAFGWRRSGSTFLPVERFHSSYWSSVILPSTSSSANFRRCALLLKGIKQRLAKRWSNHSLHAVWIAARGQGLLCVGKAIFPRDQFIKTHSSSGGQSNRGRPRIRITECAGDEQLALLHHRKRQPQF